MSTVIKCWICVRVTSFVEFTVQIFSYSNAISLNLMENVWIISEWSVRRWENVFVIIFEKYQLFSQKHQ
jgi:hypothetical protein